MWIAAIVSYNGAGFGRRMVLLLNIVIRNEIERLDDREHPAVQVEERGAPE
jgi:hypothetical protein